MYTYIYIYIYNMQGVGRDAQDCSALSRSELRMHAVGRLLQNLEAQQTGTKNPGAKTRIGEHR